MSAYPRTFISCQSNIVRKPTYCQEYQNSAHGRLADDQNPSLIETVCLVPTILEETQNPVFGELGIIGDLLNSVVLENKDDREKDDVRDDDKHNGDATPLQLNDSLDTAVGLLGCHGADALGVRRKTRPFGGRTTIGKRGQIHLDAVSKGRELQDDGETGKNQERDPESRQAVLVVDMASWAETERHSTEDQSDDDTDGRNAPTGDLREPHEVSSHHKLPADLQM